MSLKLNGATSGSVELDVPAAIGSDLNVTLPATAGEIVVANISGDVDLGTGDLSANSADIGSGNITLNANGSAGFENGAEFISNTSGKPCVYARDKSSGGARLWEGRNSGGAETSWINPDGGGFFGGGNIALNANGDIRTETSLFIYTGSTPNGTFTYDPSVDSNAGAVVIRTYGNNGTGTGGVQLARGGTSWGAYSQLSLKTELVPITSGLDKVSTLSAVTGRYKTDEEGTSRSFLIADEVQQVLPEAVSGTGSEKDPLSLRYTEVIPLLVSALHDAKARIEALEAEVQALKGGNS